MASPDTLYEFVRSKFDAPIDDVISQMEPGSLGEIAHRQGQDPFVLAFCLRWTEARSARRTKGEQELHAASVLRVPYSEESAMRLASVSGLPQRDIVRVSLDAEARGLDAASCIAADFLPESYAPGERAGRPPDVMRWLILSLAFMFHLRQGLPPSAAERAALSGLGVPYCRQICRRAWSRYRAGVYRTFRRHGRLAPAAARAKTDMVLIDLLPVFVQAIEDYASETRKKAEARRSARFAGAIPSHRS